MDTLWDIPERVDAFVAGAGPAGLATALRLLDSGAEVAAVDVRARIGHPVRCGEITGMGFFSNLGLEPRAGWVRRYARDPASEILSSSLAGASQALAKSSSISSSIVLDRPRLEEDVARIARERGASIAASTAVVALGEFDGEAREVTVASGSQRRKIRARCVIAADGVSSSVARMAGIDTYLGPDRVASCLAYRIEGAELADPESIRYERLPSAYPQVPYYLWVIPGREGEANVGLGLPGRDGARVAPLLREMLGSTEAIRGGRVVETIVGLIPDEKPLKSPWTDGLLVVGGAGRFVNPLNGGGIALAVETGNTAAGIVASLGHMAATAERLSGYSNESRRIYAKLSRYWKVRALLSEQAEKGSWPEAVPKKKDPRAQPL